VRGGFLARTGLVIGQLSVSHGLGGIGVVPVDTNPPDEGEEVQTGRRAPRAVPENHAAPTVLVYQPGAKKKRGC
jgi:hypothetical protein